MPKSKHFQHGGDLDTIQEKYGIDRNELIDFSGNINPLGISPRVKKELSSHLDLIATYPDIKYTALRRSIAAYTKADMDHIIVGNGSTELISLMIHLLKPKKALIIGPTYSEYEREIFLSGGSSHYYRLQEEVDFKLDISDLLLHLKDELDLLVLCNPNNPTSTAITREDLRIILDCCKERDIFVMIDETYVEFAEKMDELTAIPLASSYNNILVLRGISKFYAAPGLRLGYGICGNEELLGRIQALKNPWTINILASFAGEVMFQDEAYYMATRELIAKERNRIYKELGSWSSIKVYHPTANFVLFKLLNKEITSSMIFEKLIPQKILIRDASSFPFLNERFLRFCFLLPEQNTALLKALKKSIFTL